MSGDFFDGFARALVTPMPRRKALRMLAAGLTAAAVPGIRTRRAAAVPRTRRAAAVPQYCVRPGVCFCTDGGTPCGYAVPPAGFNFGNCCLGGPGETRTVCCTRPPDGGSWCCAEGETCGGGGRPNCIFQCPSSRDCEGGRCCPAGEVCVDGRICCKPGRARCGTECCDKNEECFTFRVGPSRTSVCVPRCPQKRARCGPRCCPQGEKCIDDRGICAKCNKTEEACGKKCCNRKSTFCCEPSKQLCCRKGKDTCCPVGGTSQSTAPKRTCCAKPNKCARELPEGIGGLTNSSTYVCCPPKRQVPVDETRPKDIIACCAPGQTSLGGKLIVGTGIQGACCKDAQVCGSGKNVTCCQKFSSNIGTDLDETCCSGKCVALQYNAQNCGACGRACGAGQRCDRGACVPA